MKKLLIYLPIFLLFSCLPDDSASTSVIDEINEVQKKLVGSWYKEKEIIYNVDRTIDYTVDYADEPCYKMSIYNFLEDKTYVAQIYDFNSDSQLCRIDSTITGTWRLNSFTELVISEKKAAGKIIEKTIIERLTADELVIVTIDASTDAVISSTTYYKI